MTVIQHSCTSHDNNFVILKFFFFEENLIKLHVLMAWWWYGSFHSWVLLVFVTQLDKDRYHADNLASYLLILENDIIFNLLNHSTFRVSAACFRGMRLLQHFLTIMYYWWKISNWHVSYSIHSEQSYLKLSLYWQYLEAIVQQIGQIKFFDKICVL